MLTRTSSINAIHRRLAKKILTFIGDAPIAIQLWDGSIVALRDTSEFKVKLTDRKALWALLLNPAYNVGELYSLGRLEVEGDLVALLDSAFRGMQQAGWKNPLKELFQWLCHRPRLNTLAGSRKNIHYHYDVGNSFYEMWLDKEAMQYTCAYFPYPSLSIEEAQIAKMHHIARKLRLGPGDTVVEAGCGWGGLARFLAQQYGVKIRSYNISSEQIAYAKQKASKMNLEDQVEYVEDDYRNIKGNYDVFISIGMLEHVGRKNYENLGVVIDRCLKEQGRGLIHSIGRNTPGPMNPWIEKRIFPGAYPPSLKEMMDIFEPNGFSVLDVENLRLHYAKTLEHWLARYEENVDRIRVMFDEKFVRTWRLYLASSIAAFNVGSLQLFQVVFNRALNNDVPWSRAHLYGKPS